MSTFSPNDVIAVGVPLDGWTKGAPIFVAASSEALGDSCQPRHHWVLVMDGEDRQFISVSRFGDIDCAVCGVHLAWSPALVREGVYSEDTARWIAGQVAAKAASLTREPGTCGECEATATRHYAGCSVIAD